MKRGPGPHGAARNTARLLLAAAGVGLTTVLIAVALSDRHFSAHALGWMRQHLLNAVAITAAATVAAAVVPLVIWRLGRRRDEQAHSLEADDTDRLARDRMIMLKRVRRNWIAGVLEPSLAGQPELSICLRKHPELCADAGIHPRHLPQDLPGGKPILAIFDDEAVGELLILGNPGSGKTTLLLQLAASLVDRAERDRSHPIPVVVNLASWSTTRKPLQEWLRDEIKTSYRMPKGTTDAWIKQDKLTLLLDGFEEVAREHQASCVTAINDYRRECGTVQMVVASRTQEIENLGIRLDLDLAVELQPLTKAQIADYLGHFDRATTAHQGVLLSALTDDAALFELLCSPLMLNIFGSVHQADPTMIGSLDERQRQLWSAYIARMFDQRPLDPRCGYTREQAVRWLTWLAEQMRSDRVPVFYLDRLSAGWIPGDAHARTRAGTLVLKLLEPHGLESLRQGETLWAVLGHIVLRVCGFTLTAELAWAIWGFFDLTERFTQVMNGTYRNPIWIISLALLFAGVGWVVTHDSSQILTGRLHHQRESPNQETRLSGQHAMLIGLACVLPISLASGLYYGLGHAGQRVSTGSGQFMTAPQFGVWSGLFIAVFGVPMAFAYGGAAWLRHYRIRTVLCLAGVVPWQYEAFLEAMTDRLLLRRTGSGYLFIHQVLRDFLIVSSPPERVRLRPRRATIR